MAACDDDLQLFVYEDLGCSLEPDQPEGQDFSGNEVFFDNSERIFRDEADDRVFVAQNLETVWVLAPEFGLAFEDIFETRGCL